MENKKIKLTISGKPKKIKNFESPNQYKTKPIISGKPQNKFVKKGASYKPHKTILPTKKQGIIGDFEKRKLAEQRATKRLKDDNEGKKLKSGTKKRELKLTVSRALSDEIEARERSLASVRRAREKEQKNLNKNENKESLKPIKRDINIPEAITVRELANRMAEQSSNVIKYLFGMGVTVTINQTLAADTAEYLVKEFGHIPLKEKRQMK